MAADVSDRHPHRPVLELDGVEEVSSEQCAPTACLVAHGPVEVGIADDGTGDQAPLHACALGPEQQRLAHLTGGLLALPPGDGIADRPGERLVVDPALDEVVLRPQVHGVRPDGPVHEPGEHDHRGSGRMGNDGANGLEAGRVGQPEVHEHAVGPEIQLCQSVRQVPAPRQVVAAACQLEELTHQERIARIVLDEDDPQRGHRWHAGWVTYPLRLVRVL